LNAEHLELFKLKMMVKHYYRRCYNLLLGATAYRLNLSGWYICFDRIISVELDLELV